MSKPNSLTMELSFAQVVSLRAGAVAADGYCPGRAQVQRALLRRGCVDEQYKITAFGRSITETTKVAKKKYRTCPDCEANFLLDKGEPFPPHRWLVASCDGVGKPAD